MQRATSRSLAAAFFAAFAFLASGLAPAADGPARPTITSPTAAVIELESGAKVEGRITAWDDQRISFVTTLAGRDFTRQYPVDKVLAVTVDGTRYVLGEPGTGTAAAGNDAASSTATRTPSQIESLIDRQGRQQPDWWDSAPLDYPRTLDLSWPLKPPGNWNAQRNVGQYVWDVINPNPGKWRSGIRLIHHLLELNAKDAEKRQRAMMTLGRMYLGLEQDYARAAFWFRQAGIDSDPNQPAVTSLAECYWKLGSRQMALDLIQRGTIYYPTIKLLADMGETDRALRIADASIEGSFPDLACLYAGDACRVAGRHEKALEYYRKTLDLKAVGRGAKRIMRSQTRARANIAAIQLFDLLDLARVPDGKYRASSPGYAGDVRVEVAVAGGRILSVEVVDHHEKQFYSSIKDTTRKIVEKQTVKEIDATTGATITSEAIINATARALADAMKAREAGASP